MDFEKKSAWEQLTRILRFFGRQEVKTPLSLIFKIVPYLTAAFVAILYAPAISQEFKLKLAVCIAGVFFGICLLVHSIHSRRLPRRRYKAVISVGHN